MSREMPIVALSLTLIALCALPALSAPHVPAGTHPRWPDPVEYVQGAEDLLDGEYASGEGGSEGRFPPGYPLLLVPFAAVDEVDIGAKFWVLVMYAAVVAASIRLGGWVAGGIAAALIGFSPFVVASSRVAMADAAGATCAVGALMLPRAGGWLAGFGVVIRYASAGWAAGLALVRRRFLPALAVTALLLLAFQWAVYGSPFRAGYTSDTADFGLSYVVEPHTAEHPWYAGALKLPQHLPPTKDPLPSMPVYILTLLGWYNVFYPPALPLIGVWRLWRDRSTEMAKAAAALIAGNLAAHLFFFGQSPRLVAPAAMVLTIFTAVGVAKFLARHRAGPSPAGPTIDTWPSSSCSTGTR